MKLKFLLLPILSAPLAHAATLTGTTSGAIPTSTNYNFSTGANTDWAYWTSSTVTAGGTNTSSTGPRTFTVTPAGITSSTSLLGSSAQATPRFTFSNGTDPLSESALPATGIRNSLVGAAAVGSGVQMTVGSFTEASVVRLWTYNYYAAATINVYVNGETSPTYTQPIARVTGATEGGKHGYLHTFTFTPTLPGDTLRFEYLMTEQANTAANIGFLGIDIAPVPEPSSLALLGLAGAALGLRRRR